MKKLLVLFMVLSVFSLVIFPQSVAYLTFKDGEEVYESYFLEQDELMGEYYNTLLNMLSQNPQYDQYFNKPIDLVSITDALMEYKTMEKFLNENGITLDSEKISQQTEDLYNQYMGNENTKMIFLLFFEKEEYFYGFAKSLVYRTEVINELRNYFSNFSEEDLSTYVSDNFQNLKGQFDSLKISRIVTSNESSANNIKSQILSNSISFSQAASENSIDTQTASAGGSLDWVKRGEISNNVFEASMAASPGEIIGPINTPLGYQIILVEDKKVYNTSEELLKEEQVRSQIENNYISFLIENWYNEYIPNYSFVISYEPLELAYDIYFSQSWEDLSKIEKKYREIILSNEELPEEWYIAYVFAVENSLQLKIIEKNDIEGYLNIAKTYPDFIELSEKELNEQFLHYSELQQTSPATDVRNQAIQIMYTLQELSYLQNTYGVMSYKEVEKRYNELNSDIEQMNSALKNSLLSLREINPDSIEIISKLFQNNPNDPNVAFDYYSVIYMYIEDYYNQTGDIESVKRDLESLKSVLDTLDTSNMEEEKINQLMSMLDEIDQLLNQ